MRAALRGLDLRRRALGHHVEESVKALPTLQNAAWLVQMSGLAALR